MKNVLITLTITALIAGACFAQANNKQTSNNNSNMNETNNDSMELKYLYILEETEETITCLTALELADGVQQKFYVGGDDITLDFELWITSKNEETGTRHRGMLHIVPERVARKDGGSYDTAALYLLTMVYEFYENGENIGHGEPSGEWVYVGLVGDNSIYAKIDDYFYTNWDKREYKFINR